MRLALAIADGRRRPEIHAADRGYGLSDVQSHIKARSFLLAPENHELIVASDRQNIAGNNARSTSILSPKAAKKA
jgi:hypothetical protein